MLKLGQELRSDAATDVDSSESHNLQGEITCFCSIDVDKDIEGHYTQRGFSRESIQRNHCGGILLLHRVLKPGFFICFASVAEELIDVVKARAGEDTFYADVSPEFLHQIL